MHPHLHTEEVQKKISQLTSAHSGCAEVVAALEECHAHGFLWKVTGNCTDAKHKVNMCLRGIRLERTRQNREAAKEKRERIKKVWKELDENK
ncbi:uncharacterized protein yc1106_04442 [Curvularia clavata]|uniref:COX assembly mitochondrial protein n=1 Tax=Curvularia clavata TaxID=95742 RepID=A0A9Q9DR75_CURCL|nr:uncharacterized protein yc1106_04442 [Curvularia clavata]